MADLKKPKLDITTEPVIFEIVSEPYVVLTYRGYAPVVDVKPREDNEVKCLYITASSLSQGIEEQRQKNDGKFSGINLRVKKESEDRFAKYVVESVKKDIIIGEDLGES